MHPTVYISRELPGLQLFWLDSSSTPVDLSTGGPWTFVTTIEQEGTTSTLSGAVVVANSEPTADSGGLNDVPTLSMSFNAGALDSNLVVGPATLRVAATHDGRDRLGVWRINIAR